MVKLKADPVDAHVLRRYLEAESDFDFELRVLRELRKWNIESEHGGHYEDPITKKSREFDIRIYVQEGELHFLSAIECKNLRSNFPLLVSCVERESDESFHHVVQWDKCTRVRELRKVGSQSSRYLPNQWIGKSTSQIGISTQGEIVSNDSGIFDKWSQCLSSLHDVVSKSTILRGAGGAALVLPILIVPDDTLWQVTYKGNGSRSSEPEKVNQCSIFTGGYSIDFGKYGQKYEVPRVEVMTLSGLTAFCRDALKNEESLGALIFC